MVILVTKSTALRVFLWCFELSNQSEHGATVGTADHRELPSSLVETDDQIKQVIANGCESRNGRYRKITAPARKNAGPQVGEVTGKGLGAQPNGGLSSIVANDRAMRQVSDNM